MSISIALLMTIAASPEIAVAEHAHYLKFHKKWLRLHEAPHAQAELVVDPRERAMWIEEHDKVHENSTVDLPAGFRWYAFQITRDGITERSFPVKLMRPRLDTQDESKGEQLWVIGVAENMCRQFTFSATRSSTTFHVGSGSMIRDVTINLPEVLRVREPVKEKSFLAPQPPRRIRPKEEITKAEFSTRVIRHPTVPNAE